jgi:hypothetical protein
LDADFPAWLFSARGFLGMDCPRVFSLYDI